MVSRLFAFSLWIVAASLAALGGSSGARAQGFQVTQSPGPPPVSQSPPPTAAGAPGPVKVTLDDAIQMALEHNHTLLAARSTILQNQAQEITANLRPNPVLLGDAQFIPIFQPDNFNSTYVDNVAQFDIGVSYLFERGQKRQHRLQAAKDQTEVTRSTVADNERTLTFQVATLFTNAQLAESSLALAQDDLKSFQNTLDISQERYRAGDTSEDDYLKIKLQMLQFQTDVSQARLARVQALSDLRQLLGYESVSRDYDVAGPFDYVPLKASVEDLQMKALLTRPDLRAAVEGVTAAKSQYELARANGKRDVTAQANYTHVSETSSISLFGQIQIPLFDRNQGEIARTNYAITQADEQRKAANNQVLTDVEDAYEGLQANNEVIQLYRSGYLDDAQMDRDISEYAYKRGAASLLDFLDAERSYRTTELAYRQSLAAYLLSLEQLREAVGTRSLP
jgi:outer membrane protein, heavy metal efflux system